MKLFIPSETQFANLTQGENKLSYQLVLNKNQQVQIGKSIANDLIALKIPKEML